jgi:hypothetical protein
MSTVLTTHELSTTWFDGSQRRRQIIATALVVGVCLVLARLVLAVDVLAAIGFAILLAVISIGLRPRYGLNLMFALVLLFDGGNADPLTAPGNYLFRSLQSTFNLTGAILIPFEVLVLLTAAVWLAHAVMSNRADMRLGAFGWPVVLLALALVFGVVRGLAAGATLNYAFWESRFLFSLVLVYLLTTNTIRSRADVRTLLNLIFILVGVSAIEGIWRKYALINNGLLGSAQEFWYSHDGVVVWGTLVMLVASQQVFGAPRWQRLIGPFLAVATVFVMLISERRAGVIALIVAFAVFALSLLSIKRKAFFLIALPGLLAMSVYLPLFWNNTGTLGQGARAVRSINSPDPRDAASNAWRDLEAINVRATIASNPLLGIGFGRPFLQVVTVPDISFFEFWDYEAHHDILWIWMKMGAFGFICFFTLIFGGIARSVWLARRLKHPELRTFAAVAVSMMIMAVVYCYVDLGLVGSRIPVLLGVALGTVGVLDRLPE